MIDLSKINDVNLSYLAGIIDGEGYIGIWKDNFRWKQKMNLRYYVVVSIGTATEQPIKWINDKFGGYFKHEKNGCYRVLFGHKEANNILQYVYPYLILKKDQADIAFKMRESLDRKDSRILGPYPKGRRIKPEILQEREELYLKLKSLHIQRKRPIDKIESDPKWAELVKK